MAILDVINRVPAATPVRYVFWHPTVGRILTHSIIWLSGLNRASNINVGPGSAFKMRPVYNSVAGRSLCCGS